jgi:hypothetical protein
LRRKQPYYRDVRKILQEVQDEQHPEWKDIMVPSSERWLATAPLVVG